MSGYRPRVFHGWWVVLTAAMGLCLGSPPLMTFSFSVFLKPLTQDFHPGRGAVSFAYTLFNLILPFAASVQGCVVHMSAIAPTRNIDELVTTTLTGFRYTITNGRASGNPGSWQPE